jgi:hypothetical protein
MPLVRIYVMHPSVAGKPWHVSVDGREGTSFTDAADALSAAREQANAFQAMGYEVELRQEGGDGTWHLLRS